METNPTTPTSVVIETGRYRITGNVAVPVGQRLSDYANDPSRTFFAVTEATIAPLDQSDRSRPLDFTLVNRMEISVLTPGEGVEQHSQPAWDDSFRAALGLAA
jgi:hypothetical protein